MSATRQAPTHRSRAAATCDPSDAFRDTSPSSQGDLQMTGAPTGRLASLSRAPAATSTPTDALSMTERLKRLQDLDGAALREEWRRLCRSEPPRISRDLLTRAVAYRLQELEFGGLPKWGRQSLAGSSIAADPSDAVGPAAKPVEPRPKPGTRLIREWRGRTHTVIVLDDGFEFEGRPYRSLTQVAVEITGAHWSGPRFFGLKDRKRSPGLDEARADASPHETVGATGVVEGDERADNRPREVGSANSGQRRMGGMARQEVHHD